MNDNYIKFGFEIQFLHMFHGFNDVYISMILKKKLLLVLVASFMEA